MLLGWWCLVPSYICTTGSGYSEHFVLNHHKGYQWNSATYTTVWYRGATDGKKKPDKKPTEGNSICRTPSPVNQNPTESLRTHIWYIYIYIQTSASHNTWFHVCVYNHWVRNAIASLALFGWFQVPQLIPLSSVGESVGNVLCCRMCQALPACF